ncbi:hypothetical protein SOVF_017350 isoform B [Spinacia oleracea]|nr:hypothetical protein SOVF_017350 isoform B [Spinacia oleracea]
MQMTMMATPNINKELHYLNKEDRLLRWLIVKHRNTRFGLDSMDDEYLRSELKKFDERSIYDLNKDEDKDDDEYDDEAEKQDG